MECNKEEALRAKEMAEMKFKANDIASAKNFALKAQSLFPSLEGIDQMIGTLDVYLAAEVKINGENDWYAILCVNASADEETLKKHYRKLALQLHPDKNKSLGAEGAFKLISEAWSVLSDNSRKTAYDQSRFSNGLPSEPTQGNKNQSDSVFVNGFYDFTHSKRSSKKARKSKNAVPPTQPSSLNTFWTSCSRCRMQYEYLRIYLNQNLSCPNCHQAFLAVEIGIPANVANSSASWTSKQCHTNANHDSVTKNGYSPGFSTTSFPGLSGFQHGANFDSYGIQNYQWGAYTGADGTANTAIPSVQTADAIHRKLEKLRRKQEKALAAARREEARGNNYTAPKDAVDDANVSFGNNYHAYKNEESVSRSSRPAKARISSDNLTCVNSQKVETEKFTINGVSEAERTNDASVDCSRARLTARQNSFNKEYFQINVRQQIMEKVKAAMLKKLDEWDFANQRKLRAKENVNQRQNQKTNGTVHVKDNMNGVDPDKKSILDGMSIKASSYGRDIKLEKSIDVPDPDFYDFDKDRLEKAFESEQVWATYDSEDGMPRFYAFIQKVISRKPFKVRMSFLTSKTNSELAPINWIASGFVKTCGNFRVGRYEVSDTVNIFSHRVRWEKGPRGVYKIIPKKGETWAVYKNWSPDWNELTPDDVIHKYEMVEILDDYDDENGVSVTPLLKVVGFKAVFHQHLDPEKIRRIPREEMFRFSHQVPSYLLTGEEANNSLKGCRELDPAATPVELLQIITESMDDMVTETSYHPGDDG